MKIASLLLAVVLMVVSAAPVCATGQTPAAQSTFPTDFVPIEIRRFVLDNWATWDHITGSPGQYGPPYVDEARLGWISSQPFAGSYPLYVCRNHNPMDEHFTSSSAECEGRGVRLPSPYVLGHVSSQQLSGMVPLYRCVANKNEFDSTHPGCEGHRVVGALGFIFP